MSKPSQIPDPPDDARTEPAGHADELLDDAWVTAILAGQPDEVMPDGVTDRILEALDRAQQHRGMALLAPTADPSDLVALRARQDLGGPAGSASISHQALRSPLPED